MEQRIGDWIQTYVGRQMYPLDPRMTEIDIEDIAHSLSNICRFNGHVREFYSVAEHSCHVSDALGSHYALAGLLHDASEAYLCDMPRPIKRSEGFSEKYLAAEDRLMSAIADRFGFKYPFSPVIKIVDDALLATEALQLMSPLHPEWKGLFEPIDDLVLPCWTPRNAKDEFLSRYKAITAQA